MFWNALLALASAQPLDVQVPVEVAVEADAQDALLEALSGHVGGAVDGLRLIAQDEDGRWVSAESMQPFAERVPEKDAPVRRGPPVDHPGLAEGSLSGKAIYTSQCHGWIWSEVLGRLLPIGAM